jgi:hypothetical protein
VLRLPDGDQSCRRGRSLAGAPPTPTATAARATSCKSAAGANQADSPSACPSDESADGSPRTYCPDDQEYVDYRLTRDNVNAAQFVNFLRLLRSMHPEVERFILYADGACYYGSSWPFASRCRRCCRRWGRHHTTLDLVDRPGFRRGGGQRTVGPWFEACRSIRDPRKRNGKRRNALRLDGARGGKLG